MSAFSVARGLQDFRRRHHDAEIDHLVVVALEHDADDVLADIVHVAFHRRHHDLAVGAAPRSPRRVLFLLHEGHQVGDRLLHHARGFHHLRQEHLAGAEQVADDVHAVHQRAFDHVERALGAHARLLDVGLDEIGDAVHQRMRQPLLHRLFAPGEIDLLGLLPGAVEFLGEIQQPLGRVGAAVEHHVLAGLAQFRIEIVIDRHLAGIDDAHVHAGLDGVDTGTPNASPRAPRSLPRNENDRFDTPPETCACGRFLRIQRAASMKATP